MIVLEHIAMKKGNNTKDNGSKVNLTEKVFIQITKVIDMRAIGKKEK